MGALGFVAWVLCKAFSGGSVADFDDDEDSPAEEEGAAVFRILEERVKLVS